MVHASRCLRTFLAGVALAAAAQAWSDEPKKGAADFDFDVGDWRLENRKLTKLTQEDSPWETFTGYVHMEKLPGGVANFDTFHAPDWRPGWMGMTLRIFNGETGLWSIYWLNTKNGGIDSATGALTPPVVGKFENGVGIFEGDDVVEGKAVRVRYTWYDIQPDSARWKQSFSFDGGKTWMTNWHNTQIRVKRQAAN